MTIDYTNCSVHEKRMCENLPDDGCCYSNSLPDVLIFLNINFSMC